MLLSLRVVLNEEIPDHRASIFNKLNDFMSVSCTL